MSALLRAALTSLPSLASDFSFTVLSPRPLRTETQTSPLAHREGWALVVFRESLNVPSSFQGPPTHSELETIYNKGMRGIKERGCLLIIMGSRSDSD